MHVADSGSTQRRRAPIPGGPVAAPLMDTTTSDRVAVVHVEIPAGGGMPEHDHGPSQIVLIPLSGPVELRHGTELHTLTPGAAAHIDTGERVSLANPGTDTVSLMVVASPPEFASRLAAWPLDQ
ncbi:cupin domain-containing protein [Streptomyces sp. NRRL F-5126]|uniref:cupin domain-containing protein n=1 Tax=Streptomyces sp. NRRL F-5126 TaxID=1463857 RepID=UPI0004C6F988|nr:cupin domain-containing protein [Streptomyces sp. NRRL F-5126]